MPTIQDMANEMVEVRQQIHAHLELAFEEHATSDMVAARLKEWGYEVHRGLAGTGVISNLAPLTGSEDFSFMLQECPGCYLIVGNGEGEHHHTGGGMVHNPGYDFNDAILPIAASYWVKLVNAYLNS